MPEYVKCCLVGYAGDSSTWCGRLVNATEWCFVDASHAILNSKNNGRLLLCPTCSLEIEKELKRASYDEV